MYFVLALSDSGRGKCATGTSTPQVTMSSTESIEQTVESLRDEPDDTEQATASEKKANRMAMLSPLGQAIEGRPFGHPPRGELPPVWVDQLARPSLDYDPGNVTAQEDYGLHDVAVTEAVTALEAMQSALNVVIEAREKVKKDPTLTQAAMALAVADYADSKAPTATRAVDAAMKAIETRISDAEAKLREGIPGHATGSVASEIRAYVKGLRNSTERMSFMRGLVASSDTESLAAVLKARPFLSGLTQAEADMLVHNWNVRVQPELSPRIDFLKRVRDHLERASAPFILDMQRAIGVKYETVKRLRDAKAAAKLT